MSYQATVSIMQRRIVTVQRDIRVICRDEAHALELGREHLQRAWAAIERTGEYVVLGDLIEDEEVAPFEPSEFNRVQSTFDQHNAQAYWQHTHSENAHVTRVYHQERAAHYYRQARRWLGIE